MYSTRIKQTEFNITIGPTPALSTSDLQQVSVAFVAPILVSPPRATGPGSQSDQQPATESCRADTQFAQAVLAGRAR